MMSPAADFKGAVPEGEHVLRGRNLFDGCL